MNESHEKTGEHTAKAFHAVGVNEDLREWNGERGEERETEGNVEWQEGPSATVWGVTEMVEAKTLGTLSSPDSDGAELF